MFQRTFRILILIAMSCFVGSCRTNKQIIASEFSIDTTKLQNTVTRSLRFALSDTIDFFLLDHDSTSPSRRMVRRAYVRAEDTTATQSQQTKQSISQDTTRYVSNKPAEPSVNRWLIHIRAILIILVIIIVLRKVKV